ncbi:Rossmann-like domain-containing protein [Streptomyces sp. NPDC004111]|uniref:Rossmann-like domain-containing protein n=1 Tax=Streptomyces sp. NPDC004111 TaxID=3364690 RepID=UPI0036B2B4C6
MDVIRTAGMDALVEEVLAGGHGPSPDGLTATSVFWAHHGTRLAGGTTTYLNQYVLVRAGAAFGACAFESGELDAGVCGALSGSSLGALLRDPARAVRVAALDAYLAAVRPHRGDPGAEPVTLPAGPPEVRAVARDTAIAGLLDLRRGARVALIGVVDPLVAAIRERGGVPLLCDFRQRATRWGDPVGADMGEVLATADAVVATGMTLSNGSFDTVLAHCRERGVPLVVYAQTGSAVARAFLGAGVSAVSAEPFPFSQFSADPTVLYRYRAGVAEGTVAGDSAAGAAVAEGTVAAGSAAAEGTVAGDSAAGAAVAEGVA